jgi:hypothetical protein
MTSFYDYGWELPEIVSRYDDYSTTSSEYDYYPMQQPCTPSSAPTCAPRRPCPPLCQPLFCSPRPCDPRPCQPNAQCTPRPCQPNAQCTPRPCQPNAQCTPRPCSPRVPCAPRPCPPILCRPRIGCVPMRPCPPRGPFSTGQ